MKSKHRSNRRTKRRTTRRKKRQTKLRTKRRTNRRGGFFKKLKRKVKRKLSNIELGKGERSLTNEEQELLSQLEQTSHRRGYKLRKHIKQNQLSKKRGCYSKTGYPICNVYDESTCESKTDNVGRHCQWIDGSNERAQSRYNNVKGFLSVEKDRLYNDNHRIKSKLGKFAHIATVLPGATLLPGGIALTSPASAGLSKGIQFLENTIS